VLGSGSSIKWLNGAVFCLLVAGAVLAWLSVPAQQAKLADIDLQPLVNGGQPLGMAELRGKVVLLNFWGTWCPPCRVEFPHLVELSHQWADSPRFQAVLVSCSTGAENVPELRRQTLSFLKNNPAKLPIYADTHWRTRKAVSNAVGFRGYPTTLVLDGEGQIRGKWVGYGSDTVVEIDNLIRELLNTKPAANAVGAASRAALGH
jgi:cytochrome c biogenesis protein CcmG/thiol:disulfide interchange protein DsbE